MAKGRSTGTISTNAERLGVWPDSVKGSTMFASLLAIVVFFAFCSNFFEGGVGAFRAFAFLGFFQLLQLEEFYA